MKHTRSASFEYITFSSLDSLKTYILSDDNVNPKASNSSKTGSYSFTGTNSLEEAVELMTSGDHNLHKRVRDELVIPGQHNAYAESVKTTFINDVVGFVPNVPNAVLGIPNDMIRSTKTPIKNKIVNIVINLAVSGSAGTNSIIKGTSVIYQAIDSLERQGYRCNVYVADVYTGLIDYATVVQLKHDREPFNRLKMVFPMVHPSMLRRIFFAVTERADTWVGGGYGSPSHKALEHCSKALGLSENELFAFNIQELYSLEPDDIVEKVRDYV